MQNEELNDQSSDSNSNMVDDVSSSKSDKVTSSAMERRKISKPVMEKRRRARINASLSELKTFLLDIIKKEGFRQNKMEKADILELTVKHLRHLQRQHHTVTTTTMSFDESSGNTFRLGFTECASEVSKFLSGLPNLEPDVQVKLLDHLSRCITVSKEIGYTFNTDVQSSSTKPITCAMKGIGSQQLNSNLTASCSDRPAMRQDMSKHDSTPYLTLHNNNNQRSAFVPEQSKTTIPIQVIGTGNLDNLKSDIQKPVHLIQSVPMTATTQSSAIPVGNIINGLQLVPVQFQNGDIAYAIPTNVLSNTVIPSCVLSLVSTNSTLHSPTVIPAPSIINQTNEKQNINSCHGDSLSCQMSRPKDPQSLVLLRNQSHENALPVISSSLKTDNMHATSRTSSTATLPSNFQQREFDHSNVFTQVHQTRPLTVISRSANLVSEAVISSSSGARSDSRPGYSLSRDSDNNNEINIPHPQVDEDVWRPW